MLSYSNEKESVVKQVSFVDFELEDDSAGENVTVSSRRSRSRKYRYSIIPNWKLTEEEKKVLERIMRQVSKLARGKGVRYESPDYGWAEGCYYFMRWTEVTPMSVILFSFQYARSVNIKNHNYPVPFEVIIDVLALLAIHFWSEIIRPMQREEVYGDSVVGV